MVSIVTPTYNRAGLLQKTIESVLSQTFTDWELIIVDDGSTDETAEVVKAYLKDSRIKYIWKENSGASHTRNVGAQHAKGDFVSFLDSDDEAFPKWLETAVKYLNDSVGLASVGAVRYFTNGQTKKEYPYGEEIFDGKTRIRFTSIIIKRNLFNEIGGFDVDLKSSQFTDLCFRVYNKIKNTDLQIIAIDECLIKVNVHDGPRIRTNWASVEEGSIQFIKKHYDFLIQNHNSSHISNIYSVIAFSCYKRKDRMKSLRYLLKSIKYNPSNVKNYMKVIKYGIM